MSEHGGKNKSLTSSARITCSLFGVGRKVPGADMIALVRLMAPVSRVRAGQVLTHPSVRLAGAAIYRGRKAEW